MASAYKRTVAVNRRSVFSKNSEKPPENVRSLHLENQPLQPQSGLPQMENELP
jgi:hypothetical protein